MTKLSTKALAVCFSATLLGLGGCSNPPSTTAEEQAIRAQNAKWLDAIAKHDADAVAVIYSQDGEFLPPNSPKVTGREGIKAGWQAMFQIPGVSLTFTTDKLVFSSNADMAVDIGSYEYKGTSGGSQVSDKGKSVVTWVKRDGSWQVLTDMFSSDAPILPPTPTVPPAATPAPEAPTTAPASATPATPAPATPATTPPPATPKPH